MDEIRPLRPYQTAAIHAARDAIARDKKRAPLIVAPTGSGKTRMATEIARGHVAKGGKIAWIAHRRELLQQAADTLRGAGLDVGVFGANASAPVQVESVQSILSKGTAPPGTLAVLDEAHHFVADEWRMLPEVYRESLLVGLTATPERADGLGLGQVFDCIIVAAQIRDLIAQGHLVPCEVFAPTESREGKTMELFPVDAWERYAPGTSTVVFAPHVKAANDFADQFRERGHVCGVITGHMDPLERDSWLYRFSIGEVKILINVYVLTEGWDAPIAQTCILARRVGSPGAYLQMVGRVLRLFPGKARALLLDLWGTNVETHGPPDDERIFSLEGAAIRRKGVDVQGVCKLHSTPVPCPECSAMGISEQVTPRAAGGELKPWQAAVRRIDDSLDKRLKRLAGLIQKQRTSIRKDGQPYSPRWASFMFEKFYGFPPPRALVHMAEDYLRGEHAVGERDAEG